MIGKSFSHYQVTSKIGAGGPALSGLSAEAHTSLAVFKAWYEYDWKGAEAEYRRAIELNPSYAYAHDQFAMALAFLGRFEESIAESRIAAELDPLNPQIPIDATFALTWQGDPEAARERAARAVELDPTYFLSLFSYAWIDIREGRPADAIPHLQKAKSMGASAFVSAWISYAYGVSGNPDRARPRSRISRGCRSRVGSPRSTRRSWLSASGSTHAP